MNISLFRLICIVQFVLSGYMAVSSFTDIFNAPGLYSVMSFVTFCLVIYLVVFLLQVMHKNHPDIPLSLSQKSAFNRLFLLNFIMLSVLLAANINDVKLIIASGNTLNILPSFAYALTVLNFLITIFQVYILISMVKFRRSLNKKFEEKSLDLDILAQ